MMGNLSEGEKYSWKFKFDRYEEFATKNSQNDFLVGFKDNKKYLIKRYKIRSDRKVNDLENMRCELLCYPRSLVLGFDFAKSWYLVAPSFGMFWYQVVAVGIF